VSKERARRRAEREAVLARQKADRTREVARRARRRALTTAVRRPFVALSTGRRSRRPDSALRRHRARQDGALAAALFAVNGVFWLLEPAWLLRGAGVVLSVLAWPLLVVLVFDRRRSA
jgi:hypothetical protein